MKQPNIFWIQLEGWTLTDTTVTQLKRTVDKLNRPYVTCSNMYCAAPSTMMSTLGMLSGTLPVKLATSHTSKRTQPSTTFDACLGNRQFVTDILEDSGYLVDGFFTFNINHDHFPYFHDRWQGLEQEVIEKYSGPFRSWPKGSCVSRLNTMTESYRDKKIALFFHIFEPDFDGLIEALQSNELINEDSIVIITADHGDSFDRESLDHYYKTITGDSRGTLHDISLPVENLWVPAFVSAPGLDYMEFDKICSGIDLAPTLLDFLKLKIPEADGVSLLPYLTGKGENYPERYVRIDNRYQTQFKNRIITMVTENYRYHLRYSSSVEVYPHYRHQPSEYPFLEEIYETHDTFNARNLATHSCYRKLLDSFRRKVLVSEEEIKADLSLKLVEEDDARRLAVKTVLTYLKFLKPETLSRTALYGEISDVKEMCNYGDLTAGDLIIVSDKVSGCFIVPWSLEAQSAIIAEFISSDIYNKSNMLAIYGAGVHTERLLKYIDSGKVTVIFDSNPAVQELQGIPVHHSDQIAEFNFDALIISSDSYELEMAAKAKSLLKNRPIVSLYTDYAANVKETRKDLFDIVEVKPIEWLREGLCSQVYSYFPFEETQSIKNYVSDMSCSVYNLYSEFEKSNYWQEAIWESDKALVNRYNQDPVKYVVEQSLKVSDVATEKYDQIDYTMFCKSLSLLVSQSDSISTLTNLLFAGGFENNIVALGYAGFDIDNRFSGNVILSTMKNQDVNIYYSGENNALLQKHVTPSLNEQDFCQVLKARHELSYIHFILCHGIDSYVDLNAWLSNSSNVLEVGGVFIATVNKEILKRVDIKGLSEISGHELFYCERQGEYSVIAFVNAW